MTTGRINQVTILNRRRSEGAPSPEGGGCERYREGRTATDRTSSRGHQELQRSPDAARPIQLPPLSSPEGRPRREVSGTKPPTFAACTPQEEEARGGSSLFTGRYLPGLTPERLLKDDSEANNPQTRNGACRRKTTGLQIPSPRPGADGRSARLLVTIGVSPPDQAAESAPEPPMAS